MTMEAPICEICWEGEAVGRCSKCSRHACKDHIADNMCSVCRSYLCSICGRYLAIASCIVCGRVVCYRCLDRRYNSLICMYCRVSSASIGSLVYSEKKIFHYKNSR